SGDLTAHGRLAHAQNFSSMRETAGLGRSVEDPQLVPIHDVPGYGRASAFRQNLTSGQRRHCIQFLQLQTDGSSLDARPACKSLAAQLKLNRFKNKGGEQPSANSWLPSGDRGGPGLAGQVALRLE